MKNEKNNSTKSAPKGETLPKKDWTKEEVQAYLKKDLYAAVSVLDIILRDTQLQSVLADIILDGLNAKGNVQPNKS